MGTVHKKDKSSVIQVQPGIDYKTHGLFALVIEIKSEFKDNLIRCSIALFHKWSMM